jgi:hypothetical protein
MPTTATTTRWTISNSGTVHSSDCRFSQSDWEFLPTGKKLTKDQLIGHITGEVKACHYCLGDIRDEAEQRDRVFQEIRMARAGISSSDSGTTARARVAGLAVATLSSPAAARPALCELAAEIERLAEMMPSAYDDKDENDDD